MVDDNGLHKQGFSETLLFSVVCGRSLTMHVCGWGEYVAGERIFRLDHCMCQKGRG